MPFSRDHLTETKGKQLSLLDLHCSAQEITGNRVVFSSGVLSLNINVSCGIETVSEDVDTGGVAWMEVA